MHAYSAFYVTSEEVDIQKKLIAYLGKIIPSILLHRSIVFIMLNYVLLQCDGLLFGRTN